MAAQRTVQRIFPGTIIPLVGAALSANWALAVASNIVTLNKAATDETTVLYVPISLAAQLSIAPQVFLPGKIDIQYVVGVADLDAAPTAVLSRITMSETTGARTRATETAPTVTFTGTNAVGLAVGTYFMTATMAAGLADVQNNEELWMEVTMNAAATSTIKIGGGRIWMAPV